MSIDTGYKKPAISRDVKELDVAGVWGVEQRCRQCSTRHEKSAEARLCIKPGHSAKDFELCHEGIVEPWKHFKGKSNRVRFALWGKY